ncbi:MAG: lactate utilization protein B [candidate division FCPU426 bacterium]
MSAQDTFVQRADEALADHDLGRSIRHVTGLLDQRRREASASVPDFEALKDRARSAKLGMLADLEGNLLRFEEKIKANGGHVHWAKDAEDANRIILGILEKSGAKKVVKSKSMATEEIELNHALEAAGVTPVETDLGEYVAQLKGDKPSHIILPIIHMTRQAVADTFNEKIGTHASPDVAQLVEIARKVLRKEFETADAGITGANFGVVDSGALCIVSNEGNARFVTSLPRLHIAVMGIEKLVADLDDLSVFLRVLARSATGQRLTVYSNLIWPGREANDQSGPREAHVVLLDNGRSDLLNSKAAEILACIRCGACLNICPIYKAVGGHAYGGTYPGPMGSILSPALGAKKGSELAGASTLCGACKDACPVKIDIPRMLQYYRTGEKFGKREGLVKGLSFYLFGLLASRPRVFGAFGRLLRTIAPTGNGWIKVGPWLPFGWTRHRTLKLPAKKTFIAQWKEKAGHG